MRQNAAQQLSDYRGLLGWSAFTDAQGNARSLTEIPLYIKDHPIPIRKQKFSETTSVQVLDTQGYEVNPQGLFWGTPEPLTIQISGWVITPYVSQVFQGTNNTGATNIDIITGYLEGRLNLNTKGVWQRRDPDYYISPYGQKYNKPIISIWEPQHSITPKKQPFSMTLILEY